MASKRLEVVNSHLTGHFNFPKATSLDECRARGPGIDAAGLRSLYLSPHYELNTRLWQEMESHPLFDRTEDFEGSRAHARGKVMERLAHLFPLTGITPERDQQDALHKSLVTVGFSSFDNSLSVRMMVHLSLYTDTIKLLGTKKHAKAVERAVRMQDIGCFCMTEIGHGTNVSGVETTATYDHASKSFVLHSPTPSAAKFWIGALAKTANMAVVFAQLLVNNVNQGVHVFLIQIRDYETHQPLPGLVIGDCGAKEGHHGIDNGFMLMQNFSAPYDALLDKFGYISPDGKYKSPIRNKERRFGAMLSGLSGGRIAVVGTSESMMRNALTTAIRYAAMRRQFGKPEQLLIDYELHRYRLMPLLAKMFAVRAAYQHLCERYAVVQPKIIENPECEEKGEFHSCLSVTKCLASWYAMEAAHQCRQACGGHGYSAYNLFSRIICDQDVQLTWEGDNNVLIQQGSKYLLKEFRSLFKGHRVNAELLAFLNNYKAPFAKPTTQDLTNPAKMLQLMEQRVLGYLTKSASRIQVVSSKATNETDVWNNTQVHFFHPLARSFGELYLAKSLLQFASKVPHEATAGLVRKLALLYIYDTVEKDAHSVVEHIEEPRFRELQEQIRVLCGEIGEASVKLVDAVAVSDNVLGSSIGRGDGEGMTHYMKRVESAAHCYDPPEWLDLLKKIRTSF